MPAGRGALSAMAVWDRADHLSGKKLLRGETVQMSQMNPHAEQSQQLCTLALYRRPENYWQLTWVQTTPSLRNTAEPLQKDRRLNHPPPLRNLTFQPNPLNKRKPSLTLNILEFCPGGAPIRVVAAVEFLVFRTDVFGTSATSVEGLFRVFFFNMTSYSTWGLGMLLKLQNSLEVSISLARPGADAMSV